MKKLKYNDFFLKTRIFCENHLPTRKIRSKVIDFAPSMANKLPSTHLEQFQDGLNLRLRVNLSRY